MTACVLWYRRPAARWVEALPVGNGRLGAMVFGGIGSERWQLNEDSLWTGGPEDADNPAALAALPQIRELYFEGRYAEAQQLCDATQIRKPSQRGDFGSYTTLGELRLLPADASELAAPALAYRRELDLNSAVATTRYRIGPRTYTRQCFASATGWSRAWKICFWARLGAGERAYCQLRQLLTPVCLADSEFAADGAGVYPNLLCAHPPFQIDGNFGGAAAIAELLLQSGISFLPALPAAWPVGSVSGLCARGGFEVELAWRAGVLTLARLRSLRGNRCEARYASRVVQLETVAGET